MKSIALYARVSSDQQVQRATIESQIAELKQHAEADGHVVLPDDLHADEGYSGATLARPALERLRDRSAEGGLDLIYVHAPDRLARRYAYQVLLLDEFSQHGTTVQFLKGPSGETAEDELLVQVQGMIAEYERAKILERCRRGKRHRARQGLVNPLSGAPYGYLYVRKTEDGEPARYQVLLHEAKVVRQVFEWLVHEQHSIGEIVRRLNAQDIPTRRGAARWDRSTVWGILRNPAYKGKAAYGKTEAVERKAQLRPMRGKNSLPRRPKSTYREKPPEEWIYIDVPAIISADVWAAASEQLERNRQLSQRNARGKRYLLQGLVVCAKCGYAYYGKTVSRATAKGKARWAYYRCVGTDGHRFAGGRVCDNKQVRVDQIDGYVWESVCEYLQNPKRLLEEWRRRGATDGVQAELRQYRDEAARLLTKQERSLQRLLDAYEADVIELDELKTRTQRVRQQLNGARSDLKKAEARLTETIELQEVIGRLESFHERVNRRLDDRTWEDRRQLIRMLVSRVEIDEEGATVVYRVPGSGTGGTGSSPGGSTSEPPSSESCLLRGRGDIPPARQHRPWRYRTALRAMGPQDTRET